MDPKLLGNDDEMGHFAGYPTTMASLRLYHPPGALLLPVLDEHLPAEELTPMGHPPFSGTLTVHVPDRQVKMPSQPWERRRYTYLQLGRAQLQSKYRELQKLPWTACAETSWAGPETPSGDVRSRMAMH